jgi:putative solute:sodium symporter small subunit
MSTTASNQPAAANGRSARDELAEQTAYGVLYLHRLRRAQLGLSILSLVAFGVLVGLLPIVLLFAPAIARASILGFPLGALLVAGGVFPLFVAIALLYRRRAEALDDAFRRLLRDE